MPSYTIVDYISTCPNFLSQSLKLKVVNNKLFYCLIQILSGDTSLNPGPVYNHHLPSLKEWDIFKIKGLHLIYLNVSNLLLI